MALFKKRKEKIDLVIPEIPTAKRETTADDSEIYFERAKSYENMYSLDDCADNATKQERIVSSMNSFEKKTAAMYHKYYFLKLFSKAAAKDLKFNEQFLAFDKQINRIRRNYEELKKKTDLLKYVEDVGDMDLDELFAKVNDIFDFYRGLNHDLDKFQSSYYRDLKMTSYSICNDKTYSELEILNKNVTKFLDDFKTIQEAYDFIFYNSGELIVNTIRSLVQCLENSGNLQYIKDYPFSYFLASDYVVVLKFTEWIELFTKILYVKRTVSKIELFDYLKFREYYSELEKRYIIMLIANELNQTEVR
jgi:hypothetical protein